ncbi:hypothetical protein GKZ90_0021225 [Flavobacterium sp. MC2016-06]|jgi:hypothetical protein|uniref:hypothetical protein n=1 Tax=Flavobacterium sp. MC2016-06 TaxID=2676308 RepID=UPI0012BAFAB8|nr:hypothetical protein [Flavobacterium sp. MC2016-06]MBU3861023.1 hypothetical protein [Flavobacterium sp. MC2016-06]
MHFQKKLISLIILLSFFSCQTKTEKENSNKTSITKSIRPKFEIEHKKFFVGDINNDKINDTAFVNFKWNLKTDEIECDEKICDLNIEFKNNIPPIIINESLGVFITKIQDLNHDNANEILIFSRTNEGWWNTISVLSFKNHKWTEIAKTKGFISEDKDFENRIVKEKDRYYIIGDNQWKENENGDFEKIKIKIK